MSSINVFQLAELAQRFRNVDFSGVSKQQAIEWMRGEMLYLPENEREVIANKAWNEHVLMSSR